MSTSHDIQDSVSRYLSDYFSSLDGQNPENIYQMILNLVEPPLLKSVMHRAGNNQCRATRYLGLARGTVIKKLKNHGFIEPRQKKGDIA